MRKAEPFLIASIMALAAFLRFLDPDRTSLWYDEAVSWQQSSGSFTDMIMLVAGDNYPPLHNVLLWLTMPLIGDGEYALRLPSILMGLLTVWLVYRLGRTLFAPEAGLLAAFLLAISPFHIWFSTEARMYAVFAAMGLAFLVAAVATLKRPGWGAFLLTALFGALFLYTHIYALFSFAAVGLLACVLFLLERRKGAISEMTSGGPARLIGAQVLSGLLFLPWLIVLIARTQDVVDRGFWIAYPNWQFVKVMARDMAGSDWAMLLLLACLLIPAIAQLIPRTRGPKNTVAIYGSWPFWLLASFAFGALIIAYLLSVTVQPILFDRYLIAAWPAFLLLAAACIRKVSCRILPLAVAASAVVLLLSSLQFTLFYKVRPDWRGVTAHFHEQGQKGEKIYLFKPFAAPALHYYVREDDRVQLVDPNTPFPDASEAGRLWLMLVHSSRAEMTDVEKNLPQGMKKTEEWRGFGWGESGLTLQLHEMQ
ncbi:MAG: glycosyltransferase family 39 protein [Stappiaceae bacterium]